MDLLRRAAAKRQINLAIPRLHIGAARRRSRRGEKHISGYQSNRKWRVSSQRGKSRQILQRNAFRRRTDFTFPVSLLFLLRRGVGGARAVAAMGGWWWWWWGISLYDGCRPLTGRGAWPPSFVICLPFWDLTWPGCPTPDQARRGRRRRRRLWQWQWGGGQVGGKSKRKRGEKPNTLVNKRIRRAGQGEIAFSAGVT